VGWQLVARDRTGSAQGELLGASQRRVRHAFNGKASTITGRLRLDNPLADLILSGSALLTAYDGTLHRLTAILDSAEEVTDAQGGGVSFVFSDPWVVLSDRLIGKTSAGYTDGTALAPVDKTTLVEHILAAANADYTGIDIGERIPTGSTGFAAFAPFKPAADAISEIVNNLDGPDVRLVTQEPQAVAGGVRLARLDIVAALGHARPEVVFEYGTGKRNVAAYQRAVTGRVTNRIYGLPQDGAAAVFASDGPSIATYGVREQAISADLPTALLQRLADEHVRVRKAPRQIITFQPTRQDPSAPGRVPQFDRDFSLGDAVTFRAVNPTTGSVRVNASLRVYAVEWAIDEQGAAVPSFTLTAD
jgi:hypothetical protein